MSSVDDVKTSFQQIRKKKISLLKYVSGMLTILKPIGQTMPFVPQEDISTYTVDHL